jgi:alpha/beta hydrolase fold
MARSGSAGTDSSDCGIPRHTRMCRSVLVACCGDTSLWARVRCAWRNRRSPSTCCASGSERWRRSSSPTQRTREQRRRRWSAGAPPRATPSALPATETAAPANRHLDAERGARAPTRAASHQARALPRASRAASRFADHARYLDASIDALELDSVVLVGIDWGGALAFDWAARHRDRVRAIAFMETIVRPLTWDDFPGPARPRMESLRWNSRAPRARGPA